jgi:hypothetical protein
VTALEEVGLETKFHQPDFVDSAPCFAGARRREAGECLAQIHVMTGGRPTSRKMSATTFRELSDSGRGQ